MAEVKEITGVDTPETTAALPAKPKVPGKVYESRAQHRALYGTKFRVKFHPDSSTVTAENPTGYGSIASDNVMLLKHSQASPAEIQALIETEPDYINNRLLFERGAFGKGRLTGIWEREWRVAAEGKQTISSFRTTLAALGVAGLKKIIADNGGQAPAGNDIENLVNIALKTLGGAK